MEFPDDDSLDDLLCDTSASKFNRSSQVISKPVTTKLKEKKSALLAELFGPIGATHFDTNFEDLDSKTEEVRSSRIVSVAPPSPVVEKKPDESAAEDPVSRETVVGGYTPSIGPRFSAGSPQPVANRSEYKSIGSGKQSDLNRIFKSDVVGNKQEIQSVHKEVALDVKKQQPATVRSDDINLIGFKELLDHFTSGFFDRLSSSTLWTAALKDKEDSTSTKDGLIKDIVSPLVSINQSLNEMSRRWEEKMNSANSFHEKRILTLESQILGLTKENEHLVSRVKMLENDSALSKTEIVKVKSDVEVLNGNNRQLRGEVNQLSQSTLNEEALSNSPSQKQIQKLEDNLTQFQSEISQLLKAELKWLEKQKHKLEKTDRRLHQQIDVKFQRFNEFSTVNQARFNLQ